MATVLLKVAASASTVARGVARPHTSISVKSATAAAK